MRKSHGSVTLVPLTIRFHDRQFPARDRPTHQLHSTTALLPTGSGAVLHARLVSARFFLLLVLVLDS
jgi:hypothetical protein